MRWSKRQPDFDSKEWWDAKEYASIVLSGTIMLDVTEGATHYHATYVRPAWRKTKTKTTRIDRHIFYRWEKYTGYYLVDNPHQACPFEDCGSSDAFNWNDDGYGFCHSCGESYPNKHKLPVFDWAKQSYPLKRRENIMMKEVKGVTYDDIRGIDPEVCKLYGIQIQTDADGKPVRYAYKYPHTVKYRAFDDKSKTWIKDKGVGMNHLFGPEFNSNSSNKLYLTEGEFDAASLYQILGQKFLLSHSSASIGEKFIKQNYNYLNSFKEIIYAGELDDAGRRSAEKIVRIFSHQAILCADVKV